VTPSHIHFPLLLIRDALLLARSPEEYADDDVRTRAALLAADGHGQVPGEEGQPTQEEGAHDDAQRDEGLVLLPPTGVNAVALSKPCEEKRKSQEGNEVNMEGHIERLTPRDLTAKISPNVYRSGRSVHVQPRISRIHRGAER